MPGSYGDSFSLSGRALLVGLGVGVALVLLVVALYRVTLPTPDDLIARLFQVLLIYFPTGFITGLRVRGAQARGVAAGEPGARGIAPPAVHGLVVGVLLTFVHALVFLANNAGNAARLNAFLVEAILAAIIATVGGAFAGMYRSRPGR